MSKLRWTIAYWLSKAGLLLPRRWVPTQLAYALAWAPSLFCYYVLFRDQRRMLERNLTRVLGDRRVAERTARATFHNYGRYVVDLFQFPVLSKTTLRGRLDFEDWTSVSALTSTGKGTMFVTIHLGQWEMGAVAMSAAGYPVSVVAETLDHEPMDRLVQSLRGRMGMKIIPGDKARIGVFRCLARNEVLGMLMDVTEPGDGITVDFFGAPARMSGAPARIALRTGARMVISVLARAPEDPTRIRPVLAPDLAFRPTGDEDADVVSLTQAAAHAIEGLVRQFPDQWFAFHRVWTGEAEAEHLVAAAKASRRKFQAMRVGQAVVARLPRWAVYALAHISGDIAFALRPNVRANVLDNMAHILGPSASDAQLREAAREVFRNVGRYYADLVRIPRVPPSTLVRESLSFVGIENLLEAMQSGRGLIVATAHWGNPEVAVQTANEIGVNLIVLSEPLQPPELSEMVHRLRMTHGIVYEEVGRRAIAKAITHLRSGGALAITCDRDIQRTGVPVPFFGEETMMPLGAVELAVRTGATIVPGYCRRRGSRYEVGFERPLEMIDTGSGKQDAVLNARRLLERIEPWLRQDPGQWMVLERIWKPLPARSGGKQPGGQRRVPGVVVSL